MVDIGPNAESKEQVYIHLLISFFSFCFHIWVVACIVVLTHYLKQALEFQKFWGKKAELRRFEDGRIAESTDAWFVNCCDAFEMIHLHDPMSLLGAFDVNNSSKWIVFSERIEDKKRAEQGRTTDSRTNSTETFSRPPWGRATSP
ncbi:hypothetical protein LR48_Vigan10g177600 [Vigna angularis]|uniref:Nrap protein domain-containing protein n=1 Tax=Phaseolus angularis TaxID=3914 RepID=A0A0L9VMB3_PHAAN|nr:hypothetical protein LR48_Vigan10g177600 [Vigna angularis]